MLEDTDSLPSPAKKIKMMEYDYEAHKASTEEYNNLMCVKMTRARNAEAVPENRRIDRISCLGSIGSSRRDHPPDHWCWSCSYWHLSELIYPATPEQAARIPPAGEERRKLHLLYRECLVNPGAYPTQSD